MILTIIFLTLSIIAYSISQLANHGKLDWSKTPQGFWGEDADKRKYKPGTKEPKFFLSTTLLVFATDGYHFMQFIFFILLSLSISFAIGFAWGLFSVIWVAIHLVHSVIYTFLQR